MNVTRCLSDQSFRVSSQPIKRRVSIACCQDLKSSLPQHAKSRNACSKRFSGNLTVIMSSAEVSESEEELQSWYDWIGHRVSISGVKFGILRYFGETQFASGVWCGVELDEPVGKNNGNVKGVQYFTCEDKFGIFAPLAKTSKIPDGDKCLFTPKKPVKSKLPSKLRQNFKQNDSKIELHNSDIGKTITPSLCNVNNSETRATNELFKKLRRHSEAPGDCRRQSSGVSKHLNNSEVYDNLPRRKIGLLFNPCYPRNLNECKSDFLNQTVTIEQTEIVSSPKNELDNGANLSFSDVNLLNKTIEISSPKVLSDTFQDRRDSTFILDAINSDANKEVCRDSHCDGNEDMSLDFDESLGILSPSEMKDFTLSFENACVSATPRQPGIPKNESCDDVNDLPESEVITNDEIVVAVTTDSIVNNHVNTFCKDNSEDTLITLPNDELLSKSNKESFVHQDDGLINRGFSFVHGVDEVNNLVPFSSNTQSDLLSSKQQHVGESFNANEALDYLNFSSALGPVQSHSTSSIATGANNVSNERHVSPVTDNAISKFLIDLSTFEGRTTNSSLTNFSGDKTPEGVTVSASCNLNSMLNSSKQQNMPLYQKTLLRNHDSRLSFTPILDEKMPNYALNISDLDKSARNSLSFLGVSPSENNIPKDLINFSYGSPLIQFSPSSVTDTPKLNKMLISSMRNNDQDLLPEVTVVEDSTAVNDSVSNVNKEAFPVLEQTATVTVDNLEDLKLTNFGMESNCDVVLTMPDLLCNKGLDEPMLFTDSDSKTEPSATAVLNETNSKISNTNADNSKAPSHFYTNEVVDKPDLLCYNVEDTVFNSNNLNAPCSTAHAVQLVNLNLCQETTVMEHGKLIDLSEPMTCGDEKQKSWYPLVEPDNFTTNQTFLKHEVGKSLDSSSNSVMCVNNGENDTSENPVKAEACNLNNILNQTICLSESVASSPVENCQLDQQPPVCPVSKTCSNEALENLVKSESEKQAKPSEEIIHELGKTSERKPQPVIYQSSVDLNANCPNILGAIEDISIISGDGTCFEVSDVFESVEGLDRTHGSSGPHDATHEEASLSSGNSSCNKSKNDLEGLSSTKTVFPKSTGAKSGSKVSTNAQITARPPKKNVVSKIKLMLEANKSPPSVNQENISVKNPSLMQKKTNKCDAITSKVNSGVVENKTPKPKKDVPSRINTNLARHSTPKVSLARNNFKNDKQVENKPSGQELNASKDGKNNQRPGSEKVNTGVVGAKRESRILTQLQNVDSCPQPNDKFKVPVYVSKKKSSALSSPTGSANTESSAPLSIASKIASVPKKSGLKVPSNFKSTKPEVPGPTQAAPRMRSSVGGKVKEAPNKESKLSKWAKSFVKPATPRVEPRKFVSKTELVREIQELGVTCENRTKELNLLKIRLRHATLGFEAFAILNKYMVEEFDPFAQPQLAREYKKAKKELCRVGELLHVYQTQLTELKAVHAEEIMELTEKLGAVHDDEITELKCKHIEELAEVDLHYKNQVKKLKETFKKQAEENEEQNCQKMKDLQADYERQKRELQEAHSRKLEEVTLQHEDVQRQLQEQIGDLNRQYNSLQKQLKEAEEAFMKDKNSKIQYISAKKTELEKEVDSLKAVLDIKTTQIQDLHKENFKIKKELEELPAAKEKIRKLEVKTEDLKALMQEKVKLHRELSSENQQLVLICEKEAKTNNRLSMENEELQWRLQQSVEASIRSASLCGSPDLWNHDGASFDDQRCSSRMSLPILQSELPLGLESSPATPRLEDRPGARGHSMSLSWHPSLPTHVESPLLTSTPLVRERSRSARGGKLSLPTQSKLSTMKLKRDIESEILRRNSSVLKRPVSSTPSVVSHPMSMSWGGESFADYYEEVDESCVQICADQSSGLSRKFFVKYDNNRSSRFKRGKRSMTTNIPPDPEIDIDKSMSGLVSLQTSYTSSTDSSSSFLPTQPGSEASSSSSSSGNKSQESNGFNDPPPACVKPPRELAGESMVQEVDSLTRVLFQENGRGKKENGSLVGLTDMSSSSPEDGKDNAVNLTSMATPSIETSSQGMADSTNLDVSWGDEEMPSEND